MVHLFFNIIGILIFYPIPALRIPIPLARKLGDLTAEYRWFAGFYLLFMFFLIPALVFLLSLAGPAALYMVMGPLLLFVLVVAIINILQVLFYKKQTMDKNLCMALYGSSECFLSDCCDIVRCN